MFGKSVKRVALGGAVALCALAVAPAAQAEDFLSALFGAFGGGRSRGPEIVRVPYANESEPGGPQNFPSQGDNPGPRIVTYGGGQAFCVRTCDGRYFPLARGNASPAQMCQAFCPASPTRVFFGGTIDGASSSNGERYAESENAFAFRKALRADCTCNGRDPAGLAPVDLTLDTSLRPGDVIATTTGLVAYSGVKVGVNQTAEFTPVASYPGLTADVRARLGEMKVAPVAAETIANEMPLPEASRDGALPVTSVPKSASAGGKRAEAQ